MKSLRRYQLVLLALMFSLLTLPIMQASAEPDHYVCIVQGYVHHSDGSPMIWCVVEIQDGSNGALLMRGFTDYNGRIWRNALDGGVSYQLIGIGDNDDFRVVANPNEVGGFTDDVRHLTQGEYTINFVLHDLPDPPGLPPPPEDLH